MARLRGLELARFRKISSNFKIFWELFSTFEVQPFEQENNNNNF